MRTKSGIIVILLGLLVLVASGCRPKGETALPASGLDANHGKLVMKVDLSQPIGKGLGTATPTLNAILTKPGEDPVAATGTIANGTATLTLTGIKSGVWNVRITASLGSVIAYATVPWETVSILAGNTITRTFTLWPQRGKLVCQVPVDAFVANPADVSSVKVSLKSFPVGTSSADLELTKGEGSNLWTLFAPYSTTEPYGLAPGSYTARISIVDAEGFTMWSSPIPRFDVRPGDTATLMTAGSDGSLGTQLTIVTLPDPATNVVAKVTSATTTSPQWSITVSWNKSADDPVNTNSYQVYWREAPRNDWIDEEWVPFGTAVAASNKASYSATGPLSKSGNYNRKFEFCVVSMCMDMGLIDRGGPLSTVSQVVSVVTPQS